MERAETVGRALVGDAGKESASGVEMSVNLGPLRLRNPVMVASGTFGYGLEQAERVDISRLGAVIVKGLYPEARAGNPPPRIIETPAGMLNSIGLQGIGIDPFLRDILPELAEYDVPIIVNVCGDHVEDYCTVARKASEAEGVAALELNISCPNIKEGGMAFGADPRATHSVVSAVRRVSTLPLMVKLSPNVTDITVIARVARDAGADALSLINTIKAMAVDVETRRPMLGGVTGGLSGPAIKPVALRMVWEAAQAVDIPVAGVGGIMTWRDALEFIIVGATAVQIGTGNLIDPETPLQVLEGLCHYCVENSVQDIKELINAVRL